MDDKEYIIEELTDEQRMLCQHKQDLDNKLATNRFIGDQLVMGIEGVETRLRASLEAEEDVSPHDPGDENDSDRGNTGA